MMTSLKLSQNLSDKILQIAEARHMTPEELLESLLADHVAPSPSEKTQHAPVDEYFNQIAAYIPVVFFISDPQRKQIHYVSPAYEKMMGYPLEDAYQGQRPFLEIVHPDDRSLVEMTFKQQAQGHETTIEYRVTHPDGSIRWIRSTAFPIRDANGEVIQLVGIAQDITEQKQTLDALYMNEVKLKTLFEVLPVGVSLLNHDHDIVEVNPMLEQIVGLSLADLQAERHRGRRYVSSDGTPIAVEELPSARAIATQHPVHETEVGIVKEDGDIIWTSVSAAPLPLADYSAVVVTHDITRRKTAEQALVASEMRLSNILEFSMSAILAVDNQRRILLYNQGAERIFGYTAAEMLGQSLDRLIPPRYASVHPTHIEEFAQGSLASRSMNERRAIYGLRRDGSEFPAEASISKFMQHSEAVFTVIMQDISERKRSEAAIQLYYAAVEASRDMMLVINSAYTYVIVNQVYLDYHQLQREDIIGKTLAQILGEDYFQTIIKERFDRCLAGEVQNFEVQRSYPDRQTRDLLVNYSPIQDTSGQLSHVVIVMRDITEQKQAEQQAFNLRLEHERVDILTNFIQDASHEFRTPLAIMQSSLYLISKKDDAAYRAAKLEQIEAQIDRMTRLIDMLITMSRLDSGLDFAPAPTNVNAVVREVIMDRQAEFVQKHHTLQLDLGEVPPVNIDAVHFAEAIKQIVDNALHFTPDNGSIAACTSVVDNGVVLEISDTGEGIAENDLPHVLERFYRSDTAHTQSGFGLGLAIAHKVIAEHNGTITVNNRVGGGCIVKIVLPI
jgi:PAS domain S-box-containing protein